MIYHFTDRDYEKAAAMVDESRRVSVAENHRDRMANYPDRRELMLQGALAEIAFAAMWMPKNVDFVPAAAGDVDFRLYGRLIDVKSSAANDPSLIVTPSHYQTKPKPDIYVLMQIDSVHYEARALGWQWGELVRVREYWREPPACRLACYWYPRAKLQRMEDMQLEIHHAEFMENLEKEAANDAAASE